MSPLVISAILGLFVNTLPADDKHSIRNSENFLQPIQRQLSKILKIFLKHLLEFLNFPQALNILKKRDDPHSLCIFKIRNCKERG